MAVLLNKVVLEYIPKYGQRLADEVRKWGQWVKERGREGACRVLPEGPGRRDADRLPLGEDDPGEGPGCGAEVPLIRSLWLAKKANRSVALQFIAHPADRRVDFQIIVRQRGGCGCSSRTTRGSRSRSRRLTAPSNEAPLPARAAGTRRR